jgi:chaperonin GroES
MDKIVYKPLGNRVIIRPIERKEDIVVGSLVLAENTIHYLFGKIIAVGKGEWASSTGELIPTTVVVGDTVLYRKECAFIPLIDGDILMREPDIEAIVEEI